MNNTLINLAITAGLWAAVVIPMIIRNGRLHARAGRDRQNAIAMGQLLWALADRTEPKVLWIPKDRLQPATGSPLLTIEESRDGWGITADTRREES